MIQPPPPNHEQPDQQPNHSHCTVVPTEPRALEAAADHSTETYLPQIPLEQFQSRIRAQVHFAELQRKIPVDTGMQISVSSPHCRWPFVRG
jgi:hypothetical protein